MSPRTEGWLASFFLFAGFCLVGLVAYLHFASESDPDLSHKLEAIATDIEIADATPGQKRDVVLRLHNHSGRPIRVLGRAGC